MMPQSMLLVLAFSVPALAPALRLANNGPGNDTQWDLRYDTFRKLKAGLGAGLGKVKTGLGKLKDLGDNPFINHRCCLCRAGARGGDVWALRPFKYYRADTVMQYYDRGCAALCGGQGSDKVPKWLCEANAAEKHGEKCIWSGYHVHDQTDLTLPQSQAGESVKEGEGYHVHDQTDLALPQSQAGESVKGGEGRDASILIQTFQFLAKVMRNKTVQKGNGVLRRVQTWHLITHMRKQYERFVLGQLRDPRHCEPNEGMVCKLYRGCIEGLRQHKPEAEACRFEYNFTLDELGDVREGFKFEDADAWAKYVKAHAETEEWCKESSK